MVVREAGLGVRALAGRNLDLRVYFLPTGMALPRFIEPPPSLT